jgi:hypothetical protein
LSRCDQLLKATVLLLTFDGLTNPFLSSAHGIFLSTTQQGSPDEANRTHTVLGFFAAPQRLAGCSGMAVVLVEGPACAEKASLLRLLTA